MTNSTNSTLPVQSGLLSYIVAPFAIVTITINIFFFILGLKVLKKKAHNMFVISLCAGDCLHGVSLFLLSLPNMTGQTHDTFSHMCISQITVYFLSISFTLTVALLICVERYKTVKLNNFGALMQSKGWKKKITAIMLSFTTGYAVLCMITVPKHTNDTGSCYLANHYDPFYYRILMGLFAGLFVSLALAIIVMYIMIVCTLLKYKAIYRKVLPFAPQNIQNACLDRQDGSNNAAQKCSPKTSQTPNSINICFKDLDIVDCDTESLGDIDDVSRVTLAGVQITANNFQKREVMPPIMEIIHESPTKERKTRQTSVSQVQSTWRQWELRALATCVFIIGSTLLFLCPLIFCIVADAFGYNVPKAIGGVSAILVTVRSVIDPILYVFRFKEIRNAMKGICYSKKDDDHCNKGRTALENATEHGDQMNAADRTNGERH